MGTTPVGRVALMSIHPRYAQDIIGGAKKVEFRKRPLAADVTHVLVYATAPISSVIGAFVVAGQHTLAPIDLWRRFASVAGIGRSDLLTYYGERTLGTGIAVGDVLTPAAPLCLRSDLGLERPPQSFQYLPKGVARLALRSMVSPSSQQNLAITGACDPARSA